MFYDFSGLAGGGCGHTMGAGDSFSFLLTGIESFPGIGKGTKWTFQKQMVTKKHSTFYITQDWECKFWLTLWNVLSTGRRQLLKWLRSSSTGSGVAVNLWLKPVVPLINVSLCVSQDMIVHNLLNLLSYFTWFIVSWRHLFSENFHYILFVSLFKAPKLVLLAYHVCFI